MTQTPDYKNLADELEGLADTCQRGASAYQTTLDTLRQSAIALRKAREMESALVGFADDFMTSEAHHPGYVLIPTAKFDAIRSALKDTRA